MGSEQPARMTLGGNALGIGSKAAIALVGLATILMVTTICMRPSPVKEADVEGRPIEVPIDSYVGSATCRACHPHEHDTWHDSYHSKMTQKAGPESVLGDFDDVHLTADDKSYHLTREGDNFYVAQSGSYSAFLKKIPGKAVKSYGAGDSFGELALLYACPRSATVVAATPLKLWTLHASALPTTTPTPATRPISR